MCDYVCVNLHRSKCFKHCAIALPESFYWQPVGGDGALFTASIKYSLLCKWPLYIDSCSVLAVTTQNVAFHDIISSAIDCARGTKCVPSKCFLLSWKRLEASQRPANLNPILEKEALLNTFAIFWSLTAVWRKKDRPWNMFEFGTKNLHSTFPSHSW